MSLVIMQRFTSEYIFKLRQIGLAFFEKIATDQTLAGETQDFYQGLLVGFDWAVKLIDEEDGVKTLSLLEAKLATFIDTQSDDSQQSLSFKGAFRDSKSPIGRLSPSYIAQIKKVGTKTYFEPDIEDCVCPDETQDFYHGCLAAVDFAISLAEENYAYAQISLLKTNAAYFIDLNKDWERQVNLPDAKGMAFLKRKYLHQEQGCLGDLIQADNENKIGSFRERGEEDDTESLSIEESLDSAVLEPEDSLSENSNFDELTASPLKEQTITTVESSVYNLSEDDLSTNSFSSAATRDIEQIKLAESILPTAQRAFDYVLNQAPERVEETDEYTRIRLGDLYDLIVRESEGISVSSLTADGRGELIRVRQENLIFARGILSEDVEFWSRVAERLDQIDAMGGKRDRLANNCGDVDKSDDIEI
ncbi:hypothetical protein [Coleofasciculus sp. G2-EDA-02]|uniref:hypothetical protein n=1 Tax=Coleofasciculus sp. G2-EDA-02 TaxID=3069529 RepID=UPI0032F8E440